MRGETISVIPAKAGIQRSAALAPHLRGGDNQNPSSHLTPHPSPFIIAFALLFSGCGLKPGAPFSSAPRQTMQGFWLSQSLMADRLWTLEADSAVLNENNTATLDLPHLTFYKDRKVSTLVTSLTGLVHMDTQDIELSSSVVANAKEDQIVLKTEKLYYSSSRKKIHTDLPVEVSKPSGVLHGRGLEANPDLSDIRIFHQTTKLAKAPENG